MESDSRIGIRTATNNSKTNEIILSVQDANVLSENQESIFCETIDVIDQSRIENKSQNALINAAKLNLPIAEFASELRFQREIDNANPFSSQTDSANTFTPKNAPFSLSNDVSLGIEKVRRLLCENQRNSSLALIEESLPFDSLSDTERQTEDNKSTENAPQASDDAPAFDVSTSVFDLLRYLDYRDEALGMDSRVPRPPVVPANRPSRGIEIEYRDKKGRLLSRKQAWKEFCWKFHRNRPKRLKAAKKMGKESRRQTLLSNSLSLAKVSREKSL